MTEFKISSKDVAGAALRMAVTSSRQEEGKLKETLAERGIKATAVDYGGEFLSSLKKVVEGAIVAARREGVISATHRAEGGIAGAAREALVQVMPKALGLNVGGKIGIARHGDHISVAVFFAVGLLHLNEVAVGLGHRAI